MRTFPEDTRQEDSQGRNHHCRENQCGAGDMETWSSLPGESLAFGGNDMQGSHRASPVVRQLRRFCFRLCLRREIHWLMQCPGAFAPEVGRAQRVLALSCDLRQPVGRRTDRNQIVL